MKHQEGNFVNYQNLQIYYQGWLPEDKPRGILVIAHGLHEHSGRYQHVGKFFTAHGYAVFGLDFPGHGKSEGLRSYIDSFEEFPATLLAFVEMVRDWHPGLPIFLMGHSLGGLISSVFLLDHQELINGAILSGSLVKVPDYVTELTLKISRLLAGVFPKFRLLGIDKEGLSRDPAVIQAYINDPLVFTGKTTARISNEINLGISRLEKEGSKIEIPLLLLHGGADRLCDPAWSKYLHDLVSSRDKELIIYEGLFHEIYNELEADRVFQDVLSWLEKHQS